MLFPFAARLAQRFHHAPLLALSLALAALSLSPLAQSQQTINVANGDVAGFITAIQTLNANSGGTIDLASGGTYSVTAPSDWWYGPNAFPAIASTITINGNGATISRASGSPKFRFFYVSGGFSTLPAGSLTLNDLTLTGGLAQGGNGGAGFSGGGGGGGFGGAIYNQGVLSLDSVTLAQNSALGGSGGGALTAETGGEAGGGGIGGDGGSTNQYSGSDVGGGGGFKTSGASGRNGGSFTGTEGGCTSFTVSGSTIIYGGGTSAWGGNGGSTVYSPADDNAGAGGGGGGGYSPGQNGQGPASPLSSANGQDSGGAGAYAAGAGGNGDDTLGTPGCSGGAFGGGGGGSGYEGGGGGGIGGGGGGGSFQAGYGGFAGGGGGGYYPAGGGFGGGGGGTYNPSQGGGAGGFGAASGEPGNSTGRAGQGGGGAGLGGAIFNQLGTVNATSSAFTSNSASGGPGYGTSSGFGGAIFNLNGSVSLTDFTYSGNTALDSTSTPDGGAVVYNLSHNGGNTTAIQTSTAVLVVYGARISTTNGDIQNNQANGTATVYNGVSSINELTVYFSAGGTLNSIQVLTGGAPNLDFKLISGGTCAIGTAYTAGESCTVNVAFAPIYAGLRSGAILLTNSSGAVLASKYISAIAQSPQITYSSTTSIGIGSGWNIPGSVAVDGAGNVYVADSGNNRVVKIPSTNNGYGSPATIASGGNPNAVAVDGAGNVFYTNYTTVVELPFNGTSYGSPISISDQLSPGWADPTGIAVDGAGNLFVLDYGNNQVVEVPWTGSAYSTGIVIGPSSDFLFPTGLAIDSSDNVYVADGSINAILQLTYSSSGYGGPNYLGSGFVQVSNVAVDATGNVYADDAAGGTISRIPWTGSGWSSQTTVLSGLSAPNGVGLDGQGNIYVAAGFSTVEKFTVTNPPAFSFSTPTPVGSIDTADGPQTVSLFNIGNQPLVFTTPASGTNPNYPAGFPANTGDGSLCTSAAQLAEGASCDVSANFAPLDIGTNTGNIVLTDNALGLPNATQSIPVTGANNQQTQDITFTPPTSPVYYGVSPITLVATGGASGNPVIFSIISGPGNVSGTNGTTLTITGVGTVVIAANQAGNASYTAALQVTQSIVVNPPPAVLTSPTPGITTKLGTTNVLFQWTTAPGATDYQLNLGTTAGASNVFLYKGTATSVTAATLPANDVTVYATLYSKINGVWLSNAYEYTESGIPTPAALTSPTPGTSTILGTTNVQFEWNAGIAVADYQLNLSAVAAGGSELYLYKGTALAATAPSLPGYGAKLYARLYSKINGVWQYIDYQYTEGGTPTPAALTSPTPGIGTTLGTSSVTFQWTAGIGVANYQLNLSAIAAGDSDLYLYKGTALTATAASLPANGAKVYARLYSKINGVWQYNDYQYTEGGIPTPATLTSPTPGLGTILGTTSVTFQWTAGIAVTDYQLNLSAVAAGDSDLYLYKGTALTTTAPTLPANGVKVYARLYSKINGVWQYNDYQYTEQ